jgi:dihydroorotate dehydrogenase
LFVKIAPDLTWTELDEILVAVASAEIDGIIATNTTLQRDGLSDPRRDETGGLSGKPLREQSTAVIAHIARQTGGRLPVIGVGGIGTAADICAKLDAGATLIQLYTSLVYGGPGLPGRLLRDLAATPCLSAL